MLIRTISIWCDWPGCTATVGELETTAPEVQANAEAAGWRLQNKNLVHGKALCPAHAKSGRHHSIERSVIVERLRIEREEQACG